MVLRQYRLHAGGQSSDELFKTYNFLLMGSSLVPEFRLAQRVRVLSCGRIILDKWHSSETLGVALQEFQTVTDYTLPFFRLVISSVFTDRALGSHSSYVDELDPASVPAPGDERLYPCSTKAHPVVDYAQATAEHGLQAEKVILEVAGDLASRSDTIAGYVLARAGVSLGRTDAPTGMAGVIKRVLGPRYDSISQASNSSDLTPYGEEFQGFADELFEQNLLNDDRLWHGLGLDLEPDPKFNADYYAAELDALMVESMNRLGVDAATLAARGNDAGCYMKGCPLSSQATRPKVPIMLPCLIDVRMPGQGALETVRWSCPTHARIDRWEMDVYGVDARVLDSIRRIEKDSDVPMRSATSRLFPFVSCSVRDCAMRFKIGGTTDIIALPSRASIDPCCKLLAVCSACAIQRRKQFQEALGHAAVRPNFVFEDPPPPRGPSVQCAVVNVEDGRQCQGRAMVGPPLDRYIRVRNGWGYIMPPEAYFRDNKLPLPYDATQPVAEQYICRSHYVQFIAEVSPKECYRQLTHHVGKVVGSNPDSIIRFASSLEDGRLSQLRNVRVPARLIENMPAWFKKDGIWHGGPYSHVLNIMASYTRGRRQELRHHSNHSVRQMQELDRAIAALEALIPAADAGAEAM